MAGVEVAHVGVCDEGVEALRRVAVDRLEQMADMIANIKAGEHFSDEPSHAVVQDRNLMRADMRRAAVELVDAVAGFAAEQPSEVSMGCGQQVNGEMIGALRHPKRVVVLGQADHHPGRPDADLTGEADETTGQLVVGAGVVAHRPIVGVHGLFRQVTRRCR
jgi:hypothetical protein